MYVCLVTQSSPTLCHPMDCSPTGSTDHEIFQKRILEWVAVSSSKGFPPPRDWTCVPPVSCIDRQISYHLATWEASLVKISYLKIHMKNPESQDKKENL